MFPHISHRAEACTTAASFYRSPKMVWYLYLLCSVEYRYCTISNYYGPGTPFRHAHQLFSVSWRLSSHPGVEYQEGFFFKTPDSALCGGWWEHIKSKWPTETQLFLLLAPCCCNDLVTPIRISQSLSIFSLGLKKLIVLRSSWHHPLLVLNHISSLIFISLLQYALFLKHKNP